MYRDAFAVLIASLCLLAPVAWPAHAAGSNKGEEKSKEPTARDFYAQGQEAERQGQFQRAAAAYQQAVKRDPKYAEAYNQLGYVQRQLGLYKQAIPNYQQALKLKPTFAEAHEYIAHAYLALGDLEQAKGHHAELQKLNPKLAEDLAKAIAEAEAETEATDES